MYPKLIEICFYVFYFLFQGSDGPEMALCYYNSRKDIEAKGWIYIKDITDIRDDKKSFTVVSAARTMTLEASSQAEHVLWIQTLSHCRHGGNSSSASMLISLE